MENEIDLRFYVNMLMRHWRVIAAVTLLTGVVALTVSSVLPAKYQATALVLITRPLYQFQFSPAIQNLPETSNTQQSQSLTGKAAVDLATSDALLQQVLLEVGDNLPTDKRNLFSLQKMLKARTGTDPSVLKLSVTGRDAQRVAHIANTWTGLYVRQVNDLYGKSADQLAFFEGQLAQARPDLDQAEQALVEFQKRNDSAILQAQLSTKQSALGNYLGMNESLVLLQQNVKNLQDQLARRPADSPSSLGDDLAQLMLQVSVLSAQSSSLPVQLQMPSTGGLSDRTVGQQAAYLADLAKTIESKQAEAKKQAEALPAEILVLQGQIQEMNIEAARLTRQRDLAQSVYSTLAQKVKETQISAQDTSGVVRLAGSAVAPERPLSRRRLMNTVLGLVLGLLAVVGTVFAIEYFREPAKMPGDLQPEHVSAKESVDRRSPAEI
jgi:polysaccharide biosynthesis transport protein